MSLPQHLTRGVGGTVSVDLLTRPTSATLDVLTDADASIKSSAAATVSTITSTLAAAASRGATTLSITATTGMVPGSVFFIGDDPEPVLVYKVTANVVGPPVVAGTAYLRRPLLRDHVSGAAVYGTRLSYAVLAADCTTRFFDGRVKWTLNSGEVVWSEVECTEYAWTRRATLQDLWDCNPQLYEVLDTTVDTDRLLDNGHDEVLQRVGVKGRARVFTGASAFKRATALAAWMLYYEHNPTDDGTRLFERYTKLLGEELERVTATTPRDENQNGLVEAKERLSFRSIELRR